jgi:hypothetical protein
MMTAAAKKTLIRLAILFKALETGEQFPLFSLERSDLDFIQADLDEMFAMGLLEMVKDHLVVTAAGRDRFAKAIQMLDQVRQFEIYRAVRLDRSLTEDEMIPEQPLQVRDHLYDPRFVEPGIQDPMAIDCRLAVMTGLARALSGQKVGDQVLPAVLELDPHQVVFLQLLGSGAFQSKDFWFNLRLGVYFEQTERIITHSYLWTDLAPNDETQALAVLGELYTAGQLEIRKREGLECSGCRIPLGVFEMNARVAGHSLEQCPNPTCQARYTPPPPPAEEAMACGRCKTILSRRQKRCRVCGVYIDRGALLGTERVETQAHTETHTEYIPSYELYGVVPYGYYYPYDPLTDALAFSCLCALLF